MMKRNVALVLSSGGARGIAHIGVIEELERRGYNITSIAGCSMGALIGGMYAAGYMNSCKEWIFSLNKRKMLYLSDYTISNHYIVKGEKMLADMKKTMPDINIEDCKIPFKAVSTDIHNEQEVTFSSGSLYEAIRSSISIPFFFKPQEIDGHLLMDGGLLNPLPLDKIDRNPDDLLVAINVSSFSNDEFPPILKNSMENANNNNRLFDIFWKKFPTIKKHNENIQITKIAHATISIMIQRNSELMAQLYPPDIIVDIPLSSYLVFDFFKANEIVELGRRKMAAALDAYEQKLN